MIIFPTSARMKRLQAYVRTAATVHLYSNEFPPNGQTTLAEFVETTQGIGYAPIKLTKAGWRFEQVDADAVRAFSAPAKFVFSGGDADIRGWYAVDEDGDLFASETFDDKFAVRRPGDNLEVVVVIESTPKKLADEGTTP